MPRNDEWVCEGAIKGFQVRLPLSFALLENEAYSMIFVSGRVTGDRAACFSLWLCTRIIAHGLMRAAVWGLKLGAWHSTTDDSS